MPDKSLPIIDLAYRLVLEINRTVGALPRNQRPGLGRRSEAAAFDLLEALIAARYRRKRAEILYCAFVKEGIAKESPWKDLKGQVFLADRGFIKALKTSLPEPTREIPGFQRLAERPSLKDVLSGQVLADKAERNRAIHTVHADYHYTLKEIADHLGIHYATVSKIVKKGEEEKKWQGKT